MTIYKYHYAATISVGFENGDGFKVDCSGDGYSTLPHHEIQSAIETHTSMLDDEFPNGAVNVGLNYGITRSDIGQPQPMPPGIYDVSIAGVTDHGDGSFTMSFDAGDQKLKTTIRPDETIAEKERERIRELQRREEREINRVHAKVMAERADRDAVAAECMSHLTPDLANPRAVDIDELERLARQMAATTHAPYERCLALVVSMIKTERAVHG